VKTGDFVIWNSSGGKARGQIILIEDNGALDVPDSSFTITGTPEDPAALIRVYQERGDGWEPSDTVVGHKLSTLSPIADLPKPTDDERELMPEEEMTPEEELTPEYPESGLNGRQAVMYETLEAIAEQYGLFNKGSKADGAHYVEASPFVEQGIYCASCIFYKGGQACEIVEGQINPMAVCKLWVIPENLIVESIEPEEESASYEVRAEVDLSAPAFMRASAKRGLALYEQGFGGSGLLRKTVNEARDMAGGKVTEEKWRKIGAWIARHTGDLDAVQGDEITAGLVAMLLWGGGASKASARRAQAYAERTVEKLDQAK
jgi:hypothetical protein